MKDGHDLFPFSHEFSQMILILYYSTLDTSYAEFQ